MSKINNIVLKDLMGDKMEKNALKYLIGGSDPIDGGELGEVVITCDLLSKGWGQCFKEDDCNCSYSGKTLDYCDEYPC